MRSAVLLFTQAVALLLARPGVTLRAIWPALVLILIVVMAALITAPEMLTRAPISPVGVGVTSPTRASALLVAIAIGYAALAILWHRHALTTRRAPAPLTPGLFLGFLWRVALLAAIQLAAGMALVTPMLVWLQSIAGARISPALSSVFLTTFVTTTVLLWLSLRLSLILPAAALGRPISLTKSWLHTRRMSRTIWGLAALLALMNGGFTLAFSLWGASHPAIIALIETPTQLFQALLACSVLTILYARQIQKASPDI